MPDWGGDRDHAASADRARRGGLLLLVRLIAAGGLASASLEGTVSADDWVAYSDRFVQDDGRVVDDANGGISHSEGQGYGLLLAFSAGDRATFERIWTFTLNELLIRSDGLAAWKWDPDGQSRMSSTSTMPATAIS